MRAILLVSFLSLTASAAERPLTVSLAAGPVANPQHLIDGKGPPTILEWRPGGTRPVLLLDYGRDVEGTAEVAVSEQSGNPTLHLAYSESRLYADVFGDNGGQGPYAAEDVADRRSEDIPVHGRGVARPPMPQGAARFQLITLSAPGRVALDSISIAPSNFQPAQAGGSFSCSDELLTRLWAAGAYTAQLTMLPAGPLVLDGAKRDRSLWSGDLVVAIPTIAVSFGAEGMPYLRHSLDQLFAGQNEAGALPGVQSASGKHSGVYSATYSLMTVIAAADYVRLSGDLDFARSIVERMRRALAFHMAQTDADGLFVTTQPSPDYTSDKNTGGWDWNPYDGALVGAATAYNATYRRALLAGAEIEAWLGDSQEAAAYLAKADGVREAVNRRLYGSERHLYFVTDEDHRTVAQDANVQAILAGIPDRDRTRNILAALRERLWTAAGVRPFADNSARAPVMSPYVTAEETAARFLAGDGEAAVALFRRLWGRMVEPGPSYTGALWEKVAPDGGVNAFTGGDPQGNNSLAHVWSTGPTWQLTRFVAGIQPVELGYRVWRVAPQTSGLTWAKASVPTSYGPIEVEWRRKETGLSLRIDVPAGTRGTIEIPGREAVPIDTPGRHEMMLR